MNAEWEASFERVMKRRTQLQTSQSSNGAGT